MVTEHEIILKCQVRFKKFRNNVLIHYSNKLIIDFETNKETQCVFDKKMYRI